MDYDRGILKTAVVSAIKLKVEPKRVVEFLKNKDRIEFTTSILDGKIVEISFRYYDSKLMLVTAHLPKIRMSVFFVPIDIFPPLPEEASFASRFGQMRL